MEKSVVQRGQVPGSSGFCGEGGEERRVGV